MDDHLISLEQIAHIRLQLEQAANANSALTDQFTTAMAAKDASVADLTNRLADSSAATDAALLNGNSAERQELLNSHYLLGKNLAKSRQEVTDLQASFFMAEADNKSAMSVMRTALEATERDLTRAETELAPVLAENARLTEVIAQLTKENVAFGKRPVAAAAAPANSALTPADVMAMIAAQLAAAVQNETTPMDTEDPRSSTSDALCLGTGNGRTVGTGNGRTSGRHRRAQACASARLPDQGDANLC